MRKGKPKGDGTRLESGRAMSLEGSTPSPSASRPRDWSREDRPGSTPRSAREAEVDASLAER